VDDVASPAESLGERLTREVDRVADRLRTLSAARLREPVAGYASRADAGRAAAQALADACAELEATVRRRLPELADFAVGDQVAVTGADLVAAVRTAAVTQPVSDALEELVRVRRLL